MKRSLLATFAILGSFGVLGGTGAGVYLQYRDFVAFGGNPKEISLVRDRYIPQSFITSLIAILSATAAWGILEFHRDRKFLASLTSERNPELKRIDDAIAKAKENERDDLLPQLYQIRSELLGEEVDVKIDPSLKTQLDSMEKKVDFLVSAIKKRPKVTTVQAKNLGLGGYIGHD